MKNLLMIAFSFLVIASASADEIWCTDKAELYSEQLPDISYTFRKSSSDKDTYMALVDRLFMYVAKKGENGISITVGKSGGPDATWSPIASTSGNGEVTLSINRNSLATKIFYDASDFPQKKISESHEKYFNRLKVYLEKANGQQLIDAFNEKYNELLIIHCKYVK
ncbi:MAG: hypothetical protein HYW49_02680 [Deltaproteobacteria bacterium]|nr:hypothetical protein [Deltaproteobacteria bacterium]